MKRIGRLVGSMLVAAAVVGGVAAPSQAQTSSVCGSNSLKGSYNFSASGIYNDTHPFAIAGLMYFNGNGGFVLQATDNDGGGAGASPFYNTSPSPTSANLLIGVGKITQVGLTSSCVYQATTTYPAGGGITVYLTLMLYADPSAKNFSFVVAHSGTNPASLLQFGGSDGTYKLVLAGQANSQTQKNTLATP